MPRRDSDLSACYIGVSFYRTADGEELYTAVAQVFNERDDGVVVRGGTAKISKTVSLRSGDCGQGVKRRANARPLACPAAQRAQGPPPVRPAARRRAGSRRFVVRGGGFR